MKKRLSPQIVAQASRILRCISHPDRLRIVECLQGVSLPVGEIVQRLGLDQAVVSKHLAVLRRSAIASSEVRGNFRYYSIVYPNVLRVLDCMRKHGGRSQ